MWPSLSCGMWVRPSWPFGRIYNVLMMAASQTVVNSFSCQCWLFLGAQSNHTDCRPLHTFFLMFMSVLRTAKRGQLMSEVLMSLLFSLQLCLNCTPAFNFWSQVSWSQKPRKEKKNTAECLNIWNHFLLSQKPLVCSPYYCYIQEKLPKNMLVFSTVVANISLYLDFVERMLAEQRWCGVGGDLNNAHQLRTKVCECVYIQRDLTSNKHHL